MNTVSKEFFEEKYRANRDPWNFSSSSYELNRYDDIARLLGDRSFNRAFEPACSIGVLTKRLAAMRASVSRWTSRQRPSPWPGNGAIDTRT
jgi:hypothetical protein